MAKVKFERTTTPTGLVEFSRNPSPGDYQLRRQYFQPKDFADGGDVYIYTKGIKKTWATLFWRNLPTEDINKFYIFVDAVDGSKYDFTFTDPEGLVSTARIMNSDDLRTTSIMTARQSLTVELLLS